MLDGAFWRVAAAAGELVLTKCAAGMCATEVALDDIREFLV